jgi:hypothetical protein
MVDYGQFVRAMAAAVRQPDDCASTRVETPQIERVYLVLQVARVIRADGVEALFDAWPWPQRSRLAAWTLPWRSAQNSEADPLSADGSRRLSSFRLFRRPARTKVVKRIQPGTEM